jgi:hypothetical protein
MRRALAACGLGVALFLGVGAWADHYQSQSDQLRHTGESASGYVTYFHPDSFWDPGYADIAYFVQTSTPSGGYVSHDYLEKVYLGSDAGYYYPGAPVIVYYDTSHPTRMTIDYEDNQPLWTVPAMMIGALASIPIFIGGLLAAVRSWRQRRTLSRFPWREDSGREIQVPGRGRYIELGGSTGIVRLGWLPRSMSAIASPVSPIRLCGESPRLMVAVGAEPTRVRKARPPRSLRQRDRWVRNALRVSDDDRPGPQEPAVE